MDTFKMNLKKTREALNSKNLIIHCTHIEITQKIENGLKLSGHGTIKINKIGTLYLEFICLNAENTPEKLHNSYFPKEENRGTEELYLKAVTLNGEHYFSDNFLISWHILENSLPTYWEIRLPEIYKETTNYTNKNLLYFEFRENFNLPANKSNSIISSLGEESYDRNQSIINFPDFNVSIIKHDSYYEVNATGIINPERLLESILFYISFSSGSKPQPYLIIKQEKNIPKKIIIKSIDDRKSHHISSSPMATYILEYLDHEYHFNLLRNIYDIYEKNFHAYKSITSQWDRVWHGSYSNEHAIFSLTLTVAIEGIINDIFLPKLKPKIINNKIIQEIKHTQTIIRKLEIDNKYKDKLHNAISYEKKVTVAKVLNYLIDQQIITPNEKSLWTKLRNACAHPEITLNNEPGHPNQEDIPACLNLLHNLILNVLSYEGPRYYLNLSGGSLIETKFINILDNDHLPSP